MVELTGRDALADLYAEAADELTQQLAVTGLGGTTGWRRAAVVPEATPFKVGNLRFGPGGGGVTLGHGGIPYQTTLTLQRKALVNPQGGETNAKSARECCFAATRAQLANG